MKPFWRSTPTEPDRYQVLSDLLDRNGRWVAVADAKAGAVLVFVIAILGVLIEPTTTTARVLASTLQHNPSLTEMTEGAAFVILMLLTGMSTLRAVALAFRALTPSVLRNQQPGRLYFGDVAASDLREWQQAIREWQQAMMRMTETELHHDLAEQVHTTAGVALAKHRHVDRSIRAVMRFALPFAIALYILSVLLS